MRKITCFIIICFFVLLAGNMQTLSSFVPESKLIGPSTDSGQVAKFEFEGNLKSEKGTSVKEIPGGKTSYSKGLDGQALSITSGSTSGFLTLAGLVGGYVF